MNERSQIQVKTEMPTFSPPALTNPLQRKCACGGTPGVDGLCAECRSKRLSAPADRSDAPPIVHDVPRSSGQSLDTEPRAFMEPFRYDFSRIRVHHPSQTTPEITTLEKASNISVERSTAAQTKEKSMHPDRDEEVKLKREPVISFSIVRSEQPLPNGGEGKRQACAPPAPAAERQRRLDSTPAQIAGMGACDWGITEPDRLGISTRTCRDGADWRLEVTQVNSAIRTHSRLLAGQAEPVPGVNTTAANFCPQATELDLLGLVPGPCPPGGAWYMVRAVRAHEDVHIDEWRTNFAADWTPLETAIETLRVPAAGPTATEAAATAALRSTAVFTNAEDTSNGGGNFPTFWGIPDPNANTDAAERTVVTPRIRWICQHAKDQGWTPAACPVCVAQGIT